jgi:hypothetical protein
MLLFRIALRADKVTASNVARGNVAEIHPVLYAEPHRREAAAIVTAFDHEGRFERRVNAQLLLLRFSVYIQADFIFGHPNLSCGPSPCMFVSDLPCLKGKEVGKLVARRGDPFIDSAGRVNFLQAHGYLAFL